MEHPRKLLEQLSSQKEDSELSQCLIKLSTFLLMEDVFFLMHFDTKEGIEKLVCILDTATSDVTFGDTVMMSFRVLSLILEHVPRSAGVFNKFQVSIVKSVSSALRSALRMEWKHCHSDTSMLVEEGLRLLRLTATVDNSGSVLEDICVSDLLTFCAFGDPLIIRYALETLHALCCKVVLPPEVQPRQPSSFFNLFLSSLKTYSANDSPNGIVLCIEEIVIPFISTLLEQQIQVMGTTPDFWAQLELVLLSVGEIMMRARVCHRNSTGKAFVTETLIKQLFVLLLKLNENELIDRESHSRKMLLCEAVLWSAAHSHFDLFLEMMTSAEAQTFWEKFLSCYTVENFVLLEDPFSSSFHTSGRRRKRDKGSLTVLGGMHLFVLACSGIPSVAFAPLSAEVFPVHQWIWKDERYENHHFNDEQSAVLECAFSRLEKVFVCKAFGKQVKVDVQAMTITSMTPKLHFALERSFIPFAFQQVKEKRLSPVGGKKRTSSSHENLLFASSKFFSFHSFLIGENFDPSEHELLLAETYFELIVQFSLKTHRDLLRAMSVRVFASLLYLLLLSRKKENTRTLLMSNMQSICVLLSESLLSSDSATTSTLLAVIKWLFLKDAELTLTFCITFDRCGLLEKIEILRDNLARMENNLEDNRKAVYHLCSHLCQAMSKKLGALHLRASIPYSEVEKLSSVVGSIKESAAVPGLHAERFEQLFQLLSGSIPPTQYEVSQIQVARAVMSYLLNGKELREILGDAVTYCSEGFTSSWNSVTHVVENSVFTVDDIKPTLPSNMCMRASSAVSAYINNERLENVINVGLACPLGLCKAIQLLISSLSFGLHLPSVEGLVFSSQKIACKSPYTAFRDLSESCIRVRMCSPSCSQTQDAVDDSDEYLTCTSQVRESRTDMERTEKSLREKLLSRKEQQTVSQRYPAFQNNKRSIFSLRNASLTTNLESRSHLMATVSDVERLLRTGSVATEISTSALWSLEKLPFLLRTVEMFLKDTVDKNPDSKEGKVASVLLNSENQKSTAFLSHLVFCAISSSVNPETGRNDFGRVLLPPLPPSFPFSSAEKDIAVNLIIEGLERRFSLFRPCSGYCNFHETLYAILFQEAYKSRNRSVLLRLEQMICTAEEEKNGHSNTVASRPESSGGKCSCMGGTSVKETAALPCSKLPFITSFSSSLQSRYTFHCFEGSSIPGKCRCGEFDKEAFCTDWRNEFALRLPSIAYREDIVLLSIFHQYIHRERKSTVQLLGEKSLFASSYITIHAVQAVTKSALRVALLPIKLALPRWLMYVFDNANFLIPLSIREKICRFLACGARRALLKALKRNETLVRNSELIISDLATDSSQKFSVRRDFLLKDAEKALRKSAGSRLPVSIEFRGDIGVGQGPTAQFYTLLSQEISQKSLNLWNDAGEEQKSSSCDVVSADRSTGANKHELEDEASKDLVIPPAEGLFPSRQRAVDSAQYTNDGHRDSQIVVTDRMKNFLYEVGLDTSSKSALYYTLGITLGRVFLDGHTLPLFLSSAIFFFLRFSAPPLRAVVSEKELTTGIEFPIDLYNLTENDLGMVDRPLMESIALLSRYDEEQLESLNIPFVLPGNDNFELINNGALEYVTLANLKKYQRRVAGSVLYESVANAIQLIAAGFSDVVPRGALSVLQVEEISAILCGEPCSLATPLWSYDEIRSVLVGDHGYQNESPQITMLADVLSNRFSPAEQQAFLVFISGCPRLPFGGIRALGVITVVRQNDLLYYEGDLDLSRNSQSPAEEKENIFSPIPASGTGNSNAYDAALLSGFEPGSSRRVEGEWPLPSVNTCFRYLKLPPYPSVDLMHKKLLLSITQCGGTFELS